jgi:pyrimidine operon attenuation protein / uracil phosphoribosyltransferase
VQVTDILLTPGEVGMILQELADKLESRFKAWEDIVFIGIRSGGEHVAEHLVRLMKKGSGKEIPLGELDIALYRDDLSKRLFYPEVRQTSIPFDIENKIVILVDDVLNTGRSVRAAIDHIVDLGRPRRIYLLVLFDRGGRELPIQADFVGKTLELPAKKVIKINVPEDNSKLGNVVITEVMK